MSAQRSLLTLYGVLDLAVIQSPEDPGVAQTVDQFLPRASENPGWSQEIEDLFFPGQERLTEIDTNVALALTDIVTRVEDEPEMTIPMKSRMVYILGALTHIEAARSTTVNLDGFVNALALAGPPDAPVREQEARAVEFLAFLTATFSSWEDWEEVTRTAVLAGWLDPVIEEVPLCRPAVVTIDGLPCVVIDAEMKSSKVTLNKLKNVVDVLNWPKAYPSFFCRMDDLGQRGDKWRNVLEWAGFCFDGGYKLKTPLKYIKSAPTNIDAYLDYDLAERDVMKAMALGGDGKVLVDRGYINMRCTSPGLNPNLGGVFVRTRKIAHVTEISPYAQAKMLCICGYAYAGAEMLFGPALRDDLVGYRYWNDDPLKDADDLEKDMQEPAPAPADKQPSGPAPAMDAATKTAEKWKECVNFLTKTHLDVTGKWLAGQLSYEELAKVSAQVGAKVASDPWVLLHELTQAPQPGPKPPGPVEGEGGSP